jgi:hypothetical protein
VASPLSAICLKISFRARFRRDGLGNPAKAPMGVNPRPSSLHNLGEQPSASPVPAHWPPQLLVHFNAVLELPCDALGMDTRTKSKSQTGLGGLGHLRRFYLRGSGPEEHKIHPTAGHVDNSPSGEDPSRFLVVVTLCGVLGGLIGLDFAAMAGAILYMCRNYLASFPRGYFPSKKPSIRL